MKSTSSQRKLGPFTVSSIGLGCMNLSHAYGVPPSPAAAAAVLLRALDLDVTHFDTAALYGFGANEELVGRTLAPMRSRFTLASKCGAQGVKSETGVRRVIGLSEVSAATLLRAHAVHPVAAVQSEYSLWTRNSEIAVIETCRSMGATFVAFSPLARGFLTGALREIAALEAKDIRRSMPRFQAAAYAANLELLDGYAELARSAHLSMAQLALAWVLARGEHVVTIPGTTSEAHLQENLGAATVELEADLIALLDAHINQHSVVGERYNSTTQAEIDTENF